jgi:hypothetical protein
MLPKTSALKGKTLVEATENVTQHCATDMLRENQPVTLHRNPIRNSLFCFFVSLVAVPFRWQLCALS